MSAQVLYYHRGTKRRYDITPIAVSADIHGSTDRYYRTAAVELTERANVPFDTGERVRIFSDKKLLFDGRVFRVVRSASGGLSLICHDNAYYLAKNLMDVSYHKNWVNSSKKEATLSEIFVDMCNKKKIQTGYVKQTSEKHTNFQYVAEDMQTILQGLIGLERQTTGKRYYVRALGDKLELRERGALKGVVIDTDMASEVTSTLDAENVYTEIRVNATESRRIVADEPSAASNTAISSSYYKGPDSTGYQNGMKARLKACDKWDDLFIKVGNEKGVDALALKVITAIESSGDAGVINDLGAIGLTQIIPERVGTPVNIPRLTDPEYNLQMCAEILLNEKGDVAKRLNRKMSIKNLAHFWHGWPPEQGENDSLYANSVEIVYSGFGGDANKLFATKTEVSGSSSANETERQDKSKAYTYSRIAKNFDLVDKIGLMSDVVTIQFEDKTDYDNRVKEIERSIREERSVIVECEGSPYGIAGRKAQFVSGLPTTGTWYIKSDTHRISPSGHTMTLTLSKYDETPEPEVPRLEETPTGALVESGSAAGGTVTLSGNAEKVVNEARKWVGKLRYVFGGKSIINGTGDCSGFTKYVFLTAVGINISDGTINQQNKGKTIQYGEEQPGDLVFFAGTYRAGVSHVGIITKKGYMVNLQSGGCIEERYDTGYWSKYFNAYGQRIQRVL